MEFEVKKFRRKLLVKYPFFGGIIANAEFVENLHMPTAATDGRKIYYNPDFLNKLIDDEKIFVLAHEVCHIAFDHIFRSEGKDMKLWNQATDSVINAFLQSDGLPIIKGAFNIPEAINYDAETLYNKLLKEKREKEKKEQEEQKNQNNGLQNKSNNNQNNSQGQQNDLNNKDVGHDSHKMWEEAVKNKNQQKANQNDSEETKQQNRRLLDRLFKNKNNQQVSEQKEEIDALEEAKKKFKDMGEKDSFEANKEEKDKALEKLKEELQKQSQSLPGSSSLGENFKIDNIGHMKPLVDWRIVLKNSCPINSDWSYANAQIEEGVVTPYLEDIYRPETEILLDTSGSISDEFLRCFLRECRNILSHSKIRVGCFDTQFYGFKEIKNESDIDYFEFVGHGGTDFFCAVNAFEKRSTNRIIFTDGQAFIPNKYKSGIVWIVFGNRKIKPLDGDKVIYVDEQAITRRMRR